MHLEEFALGQSFFHRLSARIKILSFLVLSFSAAFTQSYYSAGVLLGLGAVFAAFCRLPFKSLLQRVWAVNLFIVFLWLTVPFFFSFRGVHINPQGLVLCGLITLKANAILLFTVSLLGTSEIFALSRALLQFRIPKKLVYLFFFFYRYISVLHSEYSKIFSAMKLRGLLWRRGFGAWKNYAALLAGLFIKASQRSERVYNALVLRGGMAGFPVFFEDNVKVKDWVFFAGVLLLAGVVIWL